MYSKIIIDGNSIYEIDEKCMEKQKQSSEDTRNVRNVSSEKSKTSRGTPAD